MNKEKKKRIHQERGIATKGTCFFTRCLLMLHKIPFFRSNGHKKKRSESMPIEFRKEEDERKEKERWRRMRQLRDVLNVELQF